MEKGRQRSGERMLVKGAGGKGRAGLYPQKLPCVKKSGGKRAD